MIPRSTVGRRASSDAPEPDIHAARQVRTRRPPQPQGTASGPRVLPPCTQRTHDGPGAGNRQALGHNPQLLSLASGMVPRWAQPPQYRRLPPIGTKGWIL